MAGSTGACLTLSSSRSIFSLAVFCLTDHWADSERAHMYTPTYPAQGKAELSETPERYRGPQDGTSPPYYPYCPHREGVKKRRSKFRQP